MDGPSVVSFRLQLCKRAWQFNPQNVSKYPNHHPIVGSPTKRSSLFCVCVYVCDCLLQVGERRRCAQVKATVCALWAGGDQNVEDTGTPAANKKLLGAMGGWL